MALKNKKQKKSVIGKFPLGGQIGGLSPELIALIKQYIEEQYAGVASLNNGDTTTTTSPMDTPTIPSTDSLPLGTSLTPDLGADIGANAPQLPGNTQPATPDFMKSLGSELTNKASAFSLLGGIETSLANKPGYAPDVAQGISGGALSGLGAGLSMGGPMGGLIGLLGGGALGFMQSGQKREDYETALERAKKQRVKDRTVDPFMGVLYAEEGGITPGDVPAEELTPVQTEEGEMMLLPSGVLTATKAKEKHDDMDEDDVTDILPAGTIIFSNSLDNMLPINEELEDTILGYGTAFYSEDGDNTEVEAVQFEEVLDDKKKKMTFAEIATNIKNKFSTVKDHKDVFNNITNVENMQARIPFLMKLTELQDKVMGTSSIPTTQTAQAFSKGGVVKKYPLGGQIYDPKITIDDLLQKYTDFLDTTKANLEKENTDRAAGDLALEKDLRRNNVMANAVLGPLGYLMQNPQVKPAYTDTNLSGAMFRPGSTQATQGVANTGMGQVNSLTQELIRQGINPVDAISMTASARGKATEQANDINLKQLQKNEELDRAKYKFLSEARTTNEAADVKAYNDTTDQQNKIIAGISGEGKTFMKDDSSIDLASNQWRTQRAKDYYESITNLDKSGIDLGTKLYEVDAAKKQAFDQEQMWKKFLDGMKGSTSGSSSETDGTGGSTGTGTNELNKGNKDNSGELILPPDVTDTPAPYTTTQGTNVAPEDLSNVSLPSPDELKQMNETQIKGVQDIINKDRVSRGLQPIEPDGLYGKITKGALEESISNRTLSSMPETVTSPTPVPKPGEYTDNPNEQTAAGTRRFPGTINVLGHRYDTEETTDAEGNIVERKGITVVNGKEKVITKEEYNKEGKIAKSYEKDEFGWDVNSDYNYDGDNLTSKVEMWTYPGPDGKLMYENKKVINYDKDTGKPKEIIEYKKDKNGKYVEDKRGVYDSDGNINYEKLK